MARSRRSIKEAAEHCLARPELTEAIKCIRELPGGKVIKPLLSALCSADDRVKWRAVSLLGRVIADVADSDIERGRDLMRRLMWSLNDESGGIGWGAPETMAEAMTNHEELARGFAHVLVSFIAPDGQYLEHEPLQKGAVWGVGRLARFRPELLEDAEDYLAPLLDSQDPEVRGLAAWALGPLATSKSTDALSGLTKDDSRVPVYREGELMEESAAELARAALEAASARKEG